MLLELSGQIAKYTVQADKEDGIMPDLVLTLKIENAMPSDIGQLARMLGKGLDISLGTLQAEMEVRKNGQGELALTAEEVDDGR